MHDVLEALSTHAKNCPDAPAFVNQTRTLSFFELNEYVGGLANKVADFPQVVGIYAPNCFEWVVADLALSHAGRTVVPLPVFFSAQQLAHILEDAGVKHVLTIAALKDSAQSMGIPHSLINLEAAPLECGKGDTASCIIYTSGSTGRPKGVCIGNQQISHGTKSIMTAMNASAEDRYLSILPFSLLLERICGICIPIIAGATVFIADGAAAACTKGDPGPLMGAAERFQPTVSVLVPDLLKTWTMGLMANGLKAPQSLRFVAVGGAHTPAPLSQDAWDVGIPVHEGYGLSECCSVVTMNRPGNRTPGTAGIPLDGITLSIENGEIVVEGPTVMNNYLHGSGVKGKWLTGDLGSLDKNGALSILGRKDNLLVTAAGRNVNPEWIEKLIVADPRIDGCVLTGHGQSVLTAILVPSSSGNEWFNNADSDEIGNLLKDLCQDAPEYARPGHHVVTSLDYLHKHNLLVANGEPRRKEIAEHLTPLNAKEDSHAA